VTKYGHRSIGANAFEMFAPQAKFAFIEPVRSAARIGTSDWIVGQESAPGVTSRCQLTVLRYGTGPRLRGVEPLRLRCDSPSMMSTVPFWRSKKEWRAARRWLLLLTGPWQGFL